MKITIAQKLSPFSHKPGAGCIIPGTWWHIQAFPTLLRFVHGSKQVELMLQLTGPVKNFTLQQDLERRRVYIFGQAQEGYFRLRVTGSDEGFFLDAEKTPSEGLVTSRGRLNCKDRLHFPMELLFFLPPHVEKISFGSHKQQDWDKVLERFDLKELIPPFFDLSQKIPYAPFDANLMAEHKIEKNQIEPWLISFFKGYFDSILIPRLRDETHQGISLFPQLDPSAETCQLIIGVAQWIRSLFFFQNDRRLQILPKIPGSMHCGRFIGIAIPGVGILDFEWSKFRLRKAVLKGNASGEVVLDLQPEIRSFRIRSNLKEKGRVQTVAEPFFIESGKIYFFDHFNAKNS